MEDFYKGFFTGFLTNALWDYSKPYLDNLFSRFSSRWQRRTAKKKKEFETLVNELRSKHEQQGFAALEEIRLSIRALLCFVIGSWLFNLYISLVLREEYFQFRFSETVFIVIASILFSSGGFYIGNVTRLRAALREVQKSQTSDKEQATSGGG